MLVPEKLDQLPEDARELFAKAQEYQQLISTPGWRRVLDFLAGISDRQLGAIRGNKSDDERVLARLAQRWRDFEDMITMLQNEVNGTLEDRDRYLRDVLRGRVEEEKLNEMIEKQYKSVI